MNKWEFLAQLRRGLAGLPREEMEESLNFYNEMIEDRMEEGLSEEEAVAAAGTIDEIIAQVMDGTQAVQFADKGMKSKRRLKAWEILLLALGSPVWLSLGLAAFAVVLSVYVSLWSVIVSLWAVFVSMIACSLGGALAAVVFTCRNIYSGAAMIGAGFICAGLSIFVFYGCKAATKGMLILTGKAAGWMKNCLTRKGEVR